MKSPIELLSERKSALRNYRPCSHNFYEQVKTASKYMALRYPHTEFPEPLDLSNQEGQVCGLQVSDLCAFGRSDCTKIETSFGLELPPDFKAFYEEFIEGFLITRNPIHICQVDEIIELTLDVRESWNISPSAPFHVIRFAVVLGRDGLNVMLRRASLSDPWKIMTASYSTFSDEELASSECDHLITDENFDSWLTRIISTDGAPLNPQVPKKEDDFLTTRAH